MLEGLPSQIPDAPSCHMIHTCMTYRPMEKIEDSNICNYSHLLFEKEAKNTLQKKKNNIFNKMVLEKLSTVEE
jgi:hypothetical protein